jgi:hypothetical protein
MVTNRPMSFGELYHAGLSSSYQFGIVVLDVDKVRQRHRQLGTGMQDQVQLEE